MNTFSHRLSSVAVMTVLVLTREEQKTEIHQTVTVVFKIRRGPQNYRLAFFHNLNVSEVSIIEF